MEFRNPTPSDEEFRAAGMTADAVNYPLSDAAYAYRLKYNGLASSNNEAWKYAPNAWVQNDLHAKGSLPVVEQDEHIAFSRKR